MTEHFDIIIVGGGPAGLTAAIYARRIGKSVLVLEKASIGGQIVSSPKVDNFPGLPGVSGMDLAERLYNQAKELGARIELEEALKIRDGSPKMVITEYCIYTATALILATGMKHRTLDLEKDDMAGISYCSVCDGAFYEGRDVAVCGGGNTALQDAIFLSDLCRHVTLIHRRDTFRADSILVDLVQKRSNITILYSTGVEALLGQDALTGLQLKHTLTGARSELGVDGLFVAVGQQPDDTLARSLGLPTEDGFLSAGENCLTALSGVFAAGDCRVKSVRQLTTACSDGAVAALAACSYCNQTLPPSSNSKFP